MGNKLTDGVIDPKNEKLLKSIRKNLDLILSKEEKIKWVLKNHNQDEKIIPLTLSQSNTGNDSNSLDEFPKIKKLTLQKDKIKKVGDKIVDRLINIGINNDIKITLPQAVLIPNVSVITPTYHEDYFRVNQSKLMMTLGDLKSKESNPIYEYMNKDGNFTLTNHLEILKSRIHQTESLSIQRGLNSINKVNIGEKYMSVTSDKIPDKKLSNKSFDNYNNNSNSVTSHQQRKNTTASTSPLRNPRNVNIDESFISNKSRKNSEIYSSLATNLKIYKYIENPPNGRITEAESKIENDQEGKMNTSVISNTPTNKSKMSQVQKNKMNQTILKLKNQKFKNNPINQRDKSVNLNKSINNNKTLSKSKSPIKINMKKVPTIDYKLDLKQLVEQYKKKK
jgi:hypothetical protein